MPLLKLGHSLQMGKAEQKKCLCFTNKGTETDETVSVQSYRSAEIELGMEQDLQNPKSVPQLLCQPYTHAPIQTHTASLASALWDARNLIFIC